MLIEGTEDVPDAEPEAPKPAPAAPADGVAIELRDLVQRTGERTVLSGLSAAIRPGRLTVVTGPSGSGKTTLLHLLAGLDLPSAGEVVVLGERIDQLDRAGRAAFRRDRLALVAQEPPLVPFLSVRENVELFPGLRGLDGSNGQARQTLALVGLEQLTEQRVSRLSTGEQERVAIARALASEPDLLLADEPTARLDYANALAIGELLSRIARERGIAVVCATHDPAVIEQADAELSGLGLSPTLRPAPARAAGSSASPCARRAVRSQPGRARARCRLLAGRRPSRASSSSGRPPACARGAPRAAPPPSIALDGSEDRELVAPDPRHVVVRSERLRKLVREPSKRLAARGEALVAVEVLERVHVREQEHERAAGGEPPRDRRLERPRVRQARE